MAEDKMLSLPGSSWETVKKIIRAFSAAQNEENPKVEEIASLAGVPRPVVSMNNNFLRSVGFVRPDQWKLTEMGVRYALGLEMGNDSMAAENLCELVRAQPILNQLLSLIRARGELKVDTLKAEVMIRLGVHQNDRQAQFVKPLLDMLQESGLVRVMDDIVTVGDSVRPKDKRYEDHPPPPPPPTLEGLPILLGPNRLAYIQLPKDWEKKDLPKLIKMLQLALGDDVE
jgi:hypothetical protein